MGQCTSALQDTTNKIFTELFEEDDVSTDSEDINEWEVEGVRSKIVHSKGIVRSARRGSSTKYSVAEFKETNETKSRRHPYRYGSRSSLFVVHPKNAPSADEASEPVQGSLELMHAHGYSGKFFHSRQNLHLTADKTKLIYFIASVAVVYDYKSNTQKFFQMHSDDITAICIAPSGKPWCATGQKDPKDKHGKGKDLPKIWIWNYETMEVIQLLDNVCWGKIERIQWSKVSNYLYCLCGDDNHTLKIWDTAQFDSENATASIKPLFSQETDNQKVYGFELNPTKSSNYKIVDEFIMYGKYQFKHVTILQSDTGSLVMEKPTVSIRRFNSNGEKSFGCCCWIPDDEDSYVVGSQSGALYVCKGHTCKKQIESAHTKSVGCLLWNATSKQLISAAHDKSIKTWELDGNSLNEITHMKVNKVEGSDMIMQPKAMQFNETTNDLFIGTRTNHIIQINLKQSNAVADILIDGHNGEVWALCIHPSQSLFATGSYDSSIKIWDAVSMKCIQTLGIPNHKRKRNIRRGHKKIKQGQISCGCWSNDGKILAFGSTDSNLYIFSWEPEFKLQEIIQIPKRSRSAPIESVTNIRFTADSKIMAVTHMDSRMYMFDVYGNGTDEIDLKQWHATMNHIAAPTHLQFSNTDDSEHEVVKTFTRDYEIVHWIMDREKRDCKFCPWIPDPEELKFIGDPLIAGWDVQGLYQRRFDGTDLNDTSVTKDKKLIASGDDFGTVRLHNYPAIDQNACEEYVNHAEFVVGVKFLMDDSQLITIGGADNAIFQWKLNKGYEAKQNDEPYVNNYIVEEEEENEEQENIEEEPENPEDNHEKQEQEKDHEKEQEKIEEEEPENPEDDHENQEQEKESIIIPITDNINTENYEQWTTQEIKQWIESLENGRLKKYTQTIITHMKEEGIDGSCLKVLEREDFHRFEMLDFKDTAFLLKEIKNL